MCRFYAAVLHFKSINDFFPKVRLKKKYASLKQKSKITVFKKLSNSKL